MGSGYERQLHLAGLLLDQMRSGARFDLSLHPHHDVVCGLDAGCHQKELELSVMVLRLAATALEPHHVYVVNVLVPKPPDVVQLYLKYGAARRGTDNVEFRWRGSLDDGLAELRTGLVGDCHMVVICEVEWKEKVYYIRPLFGIHWTSLIPSLLTTIRI